MSNILSNNCLCVSYSGTIYYFGLYTTPSYFKVPLCLAVKMNGTIYYAPLFYDKLYSDIDNGVQIRFVNNGIPYYMFLNTSIFRDHDVLTIDLYVQPTTPRLRYAFQYSIGDMQRQAVDTKVHIKVIARTGSSSFIDDEFELRYTLGSEYIATGVRYDRKVFDSKETGFKDYDEYTECGVAYKDPIYPTSETLRITYDGVDGYYDVVLDHTTEIFSNRYIKIPVMQGNTWAEE